MKNRFQSKQDRINNAKNTLRTAELDAYASECEAVFRTAIREALPDIFSEEWVEQARVVADTRRKRTDGIAKRALADAKESFLSEHEKHEIRKAYLAGAEDEQLARAVADPVGPRAERMHQQFALLDPEEVVGGLAAGQHTTMWSAVHAEVMRLLATLEVVGEADDAPEAKVTPIKRKGKKQASR